MNDKQKNDRNALVMRKLTATDPVPAPPDRATRVASWVGWHLFELAGVSVPAMVALTVTPWAWAVSGVVGAGWTVHEVRLARQQAAIKAGQDLPVVTDTADQADETESDVDTARDSAADPAAGWGGAR